MTKKPTNDKFEKIKLTGNICNSIMDNTVISLIYKSSYLSIIVKMVISIEKMAKDLNRQYTKDEMCVASRERQIDR